MVPIGTGTLPCTPLHKSAFSKPSLLYQPAKGQGLVRTSLSSCADASAMAIKPGDCSGTGARARARRLGLGLGLGLGLRNGPGLGRGLALVLGLGLGTLLDPTGSGSACRASTEHPGSN